MCPPKKQKTPTAIAMKKTAKIAFVLIPFIVVATTSCSVTARLKKADRNYANGEYFAAADIYKKTQPRISTKKQKKLKAEVCFKQGECYRLIGNHARATKSYTQAIRYKYNDSIVFLANAKSLHALGRYSDASKNYGIYLQSHPDDTLALAGQEGANNAKEWSRHPLRYVVKPAVELNSKKNSDFAPVFMGKEAASVVFTTNRENTTNRKASAITGVANNDLFTSRRNASGKWEKPEPLEGEFNTDDDEGVVAFTPDGKTIYFTRCRIDNAGDIGGEIWTATRSGGQWTSPRKVVLFRDSTITVAHPAVGRNGERLYFVSDAPGGYGGKDIWFADKTDSGWDTPQNMGNAINTAGNEMFPCVRNDTIFYFASDGHAGFGGLDIFRAVVYSTGQWQVQNMLAPINSNSDDFGITFDGDAERGFFSSNRNQSKNFDRIYTFELPELVYAVEGKITDEKGTPLPDAIVKLVGNDGANVKIRAKKDGTFRIKLAKNADYIMLATSRGYLNSSARLSTEGLADSKTFAQNFALPTIGKPIPIPNIFFEFGKSDLTAESEKSLAALVKMLDDNPNIAIEIAAHTDCVGSDDDNMRLSEARAESVVGYLVKSGVAADRLTSRGYGESQPVVVDDDMAKELRFVRKDEVLNEKLVKMLTPEQQEIVNAINRRTEFKVLKTTYKLY